MSFGQTYRCQHCSTDDMDVFHPSGVCPAFDRDLLFQDERYRSLDEAAMHEPALQACRTLGLSHERTILVLVNYIAGLREGYLRHMERCLGTYGEMERG